MPQGTLLSLAFPSGFTLFTSFRNMTLRSLPTAALFALLGLPIYVSAQQLSANEEERLEALARSSSEVYTPQSNVTVGFRILTSGPKIRFGKLGAVPVNTTIAPASDGAAMRVYNNGAVGLDGVRDDETYTTTTDLGGGRYQTSLNGALAGPDAILGTADDIMTNTIIGNFLKYATGLTRNWSYGSPTQAALKPGYIAFSSYSATSDGGFRDAKQGVNGGVEIQYARRLGKIAKRTEWSVTTGISLNDINSKVSGDVRSTLHTYTDFYSLNGLPAPVTSLTDTYTAPKLIDFTNPAGDLMTLGFETTTPLSAGPVGSLSTSSALVGGATVNGNWQVKGAYFMVKVGPSLRTQLTERLGLTASLGLAGAYAGTNYSATESFKSPEVATEVSITEVSATSKFLSGLYADLNLEWLSNERTGLFGGLTAQKFDGYDQTVGGRTARIDLGSTVGIRGGISVKF